MYTEYFSELVLARLGWTAVGWPKSCHLKTRQGSPIDNRLSTDQFNCFVHYNNIKNLNKKNLLFSIIKKN